MPHARGALAARGSGLRRIATSPTATPGEVALACCAAICGDDASARSSHLSEAELDASERYHPPRIDALRAGLRRRARPIVIPVLAALLRRR